jgi:hypothetical protein
MEVSGDLGCRTHRKKSAGGVDGVAEKLWDDDTRDNLLLGIAGAATALGTMSEIETDEYGPRLEFCSVPPKKRKSQPLRKHH